MSETGMSRATFGLLLNAVHPIEENLAQRLIEHREQVALARASGFKSIVAGQHFLTQPIQVPATIPFLSSLADISGEMHLVLGVLILPLQHPVSLAQEIATLDWLSGGRVIVGGGLGYRAPEYAAFGIETRERVGRFEECIAVMKAIWAAKDAWSYHGRYYNFEELPGGLKPMQQPHPPLWVAADVDNAVLRAATLGAAWYINPRAELSQLRHQIDIYRRALNESSNKMPPIFPIRREAFLAPSDREARLLAVRHLRGMLDLYRRWGQYDIMPGGNKAQTVFDEENIPDTYLVGSPERVADLLEMYIETLDVNHFVLRMQWPGMLHREVMKSIELVGDYLIPHFA